MTSVGINISSIKGNRLECTRSDKLLLIKNIHLDTNQAELKELFARYGPVEKCLMSPSGTLAVVEYKSAGRAKTAIEKLQYFYVHNLPIYLEFAPTGFIETQAEAEERLYETRLA